MRTRAVARDLIVALLVLGVGAAVLRLSVRPGGDHRAYSFANAGPDGSRAFHLLLERLGYDVGAVDGSPVQGVHDAAGRAVVIQGGEALHEADALAGLYMGWVSRGGTLLLLLDKADAGSSDLLVTAGLGIEGAADGDWISARPPALSPYGRGVADVFIQKGARAVATGSTVTAVRTDLALASPVCVSGHVGCGRVVLVADADIASNDGLRHGDNALFLTNILDSVGAHRVDFAALGPASPAQTTPPADQNEQVPFALNTLAILGLLAYGIGKRLGPPEPDVAETAPAIDRVGYIQATAHLMRNAKARAMALRALVSYGRRENLGPEYATALSSERLTDEQLLLLASGLHHRAQ